MKKILAITLSMAFAILTAMNGTAQDQQDPFKKGQQPATANQSTITGSNTGGQETKLVTRTYKVLPSTIDVMTGGAVAHADTATADGKISSANRPDIKKFLNDAGVPFPENTSIVYIPAQSLLIVKNTSENLDIFERLLSKLNIGTLLVSVEMRMIEMPKLAADELFKEQGGLAKAFVINEKTLGAISEMVIKNKAKVVSQSKIITISGANCQNKSACEFIYPTEYDVRGSDATNSVKALPDSKSNATNSVTVSPDILIPTAFETRDCGTILDVTPTIGPDMQVIDVVVMSQRVRLSAFPNKIIVNSPAGKTEVEQPVFISEDVTTSLTIQNGTTVLVSVCDAISDQEKQEKAGENIILFIMTANIMTVNSMTVNAAMTPP